MISGMLGHAGVRSGTAAMYNDASRPNSRQPYSDDMENCAVSGSLGTPPMGCYDSQSTGQMTFIGQHQWTRFDRCLIRYVTESIDFKVLKIIVDPQSNEESAENSYLK